MHMVNINHTNLLDRKYTVRIKCYLENLEFYFLNIFCLGLVYIKAYNTRKAMQKYNQPMKSDEFCITRPTTS